MTRDELQQLVLKASEYNNNILLKWATGVGKSRGIINIQDKHCKNKRVLLVVAEIAHIDNWRQEYVAFNKEYLLETTEIICYASLKNYANTSYDMLILDEVHHSSDNRLLILSTIGAERVVVASATVEIEVYAGLVSIYGKFYTSIYTLKGAIEEGILAVPKIILLPFTLDDTTKNATVIEEWGVEEKRVLIKCNSLQDRWTYLKDKKKYPNVKLEIKCSNKDKYNYINDKIEYLKQLYLTTGNTGIKFKWLQSCVTRKTFMGEVKTRAAKILIDKIKATGERFICFCTNIAQVEELGSTTGIHSKKKGSLNTISKFNAKEINSLFCCKMLQEGQNLVNTNYSVIIQLDGKEGIFIQRLGRVLRSTKPIQFIMYLENTRDEEFLTNVLDQVNLEYVETANLNTLKL